MGKKHKIGYKRPKQSDTKVGSLARVLQMPLDVIFEARTRWPSTTVWKAARGNIPGLPDIPPNMSEPAWANLVFDRHCHYCLTKGVRQILWKQRMRLCNACTKAQHDPWSLLGCAEPPKPSSAHHHSDATYRSQLICPRQDFEEAKTAILGISDPLARTAFIVQSKDRHAASCELWVKDRSEAWARQQKQIEMTRVQDIKDKAKNLGYDVDAKELTEYFNVPPFKIPQPLTPQVWNRIKHLLVLRLDDAKSKVKVCGSPSFALAFLRRFRTFRFLHTDDLKVAKFREASFLMQNIISSPLPWTIASPFDDVAEGLLHGLFDKWRDSVRKHLLKQLACTSQGSHFTSGDDTRGSISSEPTLDEGDEGLRRLSLATTVFTCVCSQIHDASAEPPAIKLLFYSQVLGHICIARTPTLGPPGSQSWDCSSLLLYLSLGAMVGRLIRTVHLDPATTTVQYMDELDVYFACLCCAVRGENEIELYNTHALRWKEAVRHEYDAHQHEDVSWQVLITAQVEKGRQDDGSISHTNKWFCGWCHWLLFPDLPVDPEDLKVHLASVHQISEPEQDRDYFEDVSSPRCGYSYLPLDIPVSLMYTRRTRK
ncbi:hypothetical protein DFH08DRAFT_1032596 [Mycena albidolilacea]|uniref:Uncharacterized protein n=1 Tax=Mycena albidolilacea TaxID=1033008 RepID=A0AAD7F2I9_9AGAR|nr:hypothetical protein DFH08DRAFT_1032596 [Mycena albidolilacea]